jgi:hypothetical protein
VSADVRRCSISLVRTLCPQNGSVDIAFVQVQGNGAVVPQYSDVPIAS